MTDIQIGQTGHAGRITLNRPDALNALTAEMSVRIETALTRWATDDTVRLVVIDAEGEKAFCAGGDIADLYAKGTAGEFTFGQDFWRQEYRMNAMIAGYGKPVVTFLPGFTMGGGVGVGCHASHRIVCENSQIAMPECGIGLVPDVGGSFLLGRAPGHLGEYLGLTSARMAAGDAIHAGFADHFVPHDRWAALTETLERDGDAGAVAQMAVTPPPSQMATDAVEIDTLFARDTLGDIVIACGAAEGDVAAAATKALSRNAPLAMACALQLIRDARTGASLTQALRHEYRYTFRAQEQGDFLEGIRAAIIDRDRNPAWAHRSAAQVSDADIAAMLAPLGDDALILSSKETP
ncbi:enoyl-CoA hydratase/isomerase family protein [Loktanella sp. SALINAS62]|uniref:enoyl-CoA hydratase/isomerase family protein n=1 Tax=Loktanella sp. SALINAS62 TaxID=2706124 RepID=UPI001B8C9F5C|nr:enoyl-CoA hydratase/isomerase family protein [Loktanella sp. SALINAS62]MBS1302563.1 enoyl-CoA hydratase/isomerase family protein [Loktanella sp. SALINAS62]